MKTKTRTNMRRYTIRDKHTGGILATVKATSPESAKKKFCLGNPAYLRRDLMAYD